MVKSEKWISMLLSMLAVPLMLTGCVKSTGNTANIKKDRLSVVTTIFAPYDFARQVAGDKADVTMLLPPGAESHSYEPTPQDIIKIQNCDVFIYGGGESDAWVTDVLSSIDHPKFKIVTFMDCVDLVKEETVEGMEQKKEEQQKDAEYDEHVWTSPKNVIKITEKISDTLCSADEADREYYTANTAAYVQKLKELDSAFQEVVANAKRKTLVFGDRFPLRYFVDAYGLDYYAAFPGCAEETEPSAATIAFLINKVRDEKIPVVFHIELSNEEIADSICEATGAKKCQFNACHNVTKSDFEKGVTYLDLMRQNVEVLKEALQ